MLDKPHLLAAARYVELNPVRAGLVAAASQFRWSSARAHLKGEDDDLVRAEPLLAMARNWRRLLTGAVREEDLREFRQHERTGRVLGGGAFQISHPRHTKPK